MKLSSFAFLLATLYVAPQQAYAETRYVFPRWPGKPPTVIYDVKTVRPVAPDGTERAALAFCPSGKLTSHTTLKPLFAKWPPVYVREKTYSCAKPEAVSSR